MATPHDNVSMQDERPDTSMGIERELAHPMLGGVCAGCTYATEGCGECCICIYARNVLRAIDECLPRPSEAPV